MQTEARARVVVEGGGGRGGQRVMNTGHGAVVVDGGASGAAHKLMEQHKERAFHHNHQSHIGTVSQLLAGGIAGAVGKTCTAPLARLTILFQLQGMHYDAASLKKASIWHEARRIMREEGFRAFWKGNLVTIAHRLPYSSVSFYTFERYKNLLQLIWGVESPGENVRKDLCIRLIAGGLAGITAASVTYPLDLVRTRLAAQTNVAYYRGIWHALCTISREEGAFGLYKGLGATLLGVGPNLAISFSVYDTARTLWHFHRPDDSTVLVSLSCGSLSGIASSTATFPLDLVRRRMQLEGVGGRARVYKTGLFGTFRHIFRTEGFRGFIKHSWKLTLLVSRKVTSYIQAQCMI
ncbi:mitochondrial substrate carrier family protein B-like isoform X2 [Coffea eugenioides]|uniref:mitochondrial substrate carrier family protein B-like isoform X2 n=1 Tax=Coffea eugenioides TaxID=49369 RepID=UPI000F606CFA|nr:mitochondrial substrate carrier family protein B-like isoform X2 [Coffea eugenioides]